MSKIEVNTIDTVTGTTELTLGNSTATTVTLGSSAVFSNVSGHNYPMFLATLTANQNISDNVLTRVIWNETDFDTGSYFDTTTGRFTPLVAGKYFIYTNCTLVVNAVQIEFCRLELYKNTTRIYRTTSNMDDDTSQGEQMYTGIVVDLDGVDDYVEVKVVIAHGTGQASVDGGDDNSSWFGGYRIGA